MLLITGKKYTSVPARAILPPQKRVGVFNIVEWSVCHPGTHFSSSSICRFPPILLPPTPTDLAGDLQTNLCLIVLEQCSLLLTREMSYLISGEVNDLSSAV